MIVSGTLFSLSAMFLLCAAILLWALQFCSGTSDFSAAFWFESCGRHALLQGALRLQSAMGFVSRATRRRYRRLPLSLCVFTSTPVSYAFECHMPLSVICL